MKRIVIATAFLFGITVAFSQNVAITDDNTYSAHPSAMLDVKSTTKGMLVPRVTTTQRNAISNPADGLLVFDTTADAFYFYNSGTWTNLTSGSPSGLWGQSGNYVFLNDNNKQLGIGTHTPYGKVEIKADGSINWDTPIFGVVNFNGDTVFAVYPGGVRVNVEDDQTKVSGNRGGFAVGGFSQAKSFTKDFLQVTPDSVRVYVANASPVSGNRGGFAVGGFSQAKGAYADLLFVDPDSTRIWTEGNSGFEVLDMAQGNTNYLDLNPVNYFIGHESGDLNVSGQYNSFMGYQAGKANISGSSSVMLGYKAGMANTSGLRNIFIGYHAGISNTEGTSNVFIGTESGNDNIGVGAFAGDYNVFIGDQSGMKNTYGVSNVFIGDKAGLMNTNGNYNLYLGKGAGGTIASASYNVLLGGQTGAYKTAGNNNTMVGYAAGSQNSTGAGNVFIGFNAGYNETGSNKLYIENSNSATPLIYGDFSTNETEINGSLHVVDEYFDSSGDAGTNGQVLSSTGSGTNWVNGGTISGVTAGVGLTGGGTTGAVTIDIGASPGVLLNADGFSVYGLSASDGSPTNAVYCNSGGSVGIGTTTPSQKLEVAGNTKLSSAAPQLHFEETDQTNKLWILGTDGGDIWIGENSTSALDRRLQIEEGGQIGIGTTVPAAQLEIVYADAPELMAGKWMTLSSCDGGINIISSNAYLDNSETFRYTNTHSSMGASGISMNWGDLRFFASTGSVAANASFTPNYVGVFKPTGEFGIGTLSPVEKLDVEGAINIGTTTGTNAGTIRWTGADFQGYNGTSWLSLTSSGDITGVTAGSGLIGGGTTGSVTLSVGPGDGIDVLSTVVAVDVTDLVGSGLMEEATNNLSVRAGDGIDVTANVAVDVTDILGTGLREDASNNILVYGLCADDGSPTNAAYCNSLGYLGVGTTSPAVHLDVVGDGKFQGGDLTIWSSTKALHFRQDGSNSFISNKAGFVGNGSASNGELILNGEGGLRLSYGTAGSAGTTALQVTSAGNVGIGTQTPGALLDVYNGNTILDNYMYLRDYDDGTITNAVRSISRDGNWVFYGCGVGIGTYGDGGSDFGSGALMVQNKVGIGVTSTSYNLEVNGTAAKTGGGSWSVSSDRRLKDVHGKYEKGLIEILALNPVKFNYKKDNPRNLDSNTEQIGFIAQEVKEIFPEAVTELADGYYDFNIHSVNVAMVNAIKEQQKQIEYLNERVGKVEQLEKENKQLREEVSQIRETLSAIAKK